MFLLQVYQFVLREMEYSVPIRNDNHEAIKQANNILSSQRTSLGTCIKRFIRDANYRESARGISGE